MLPPRRIEIQPQPDGVTCGPTCLHAVYRYFDDPVALPEVIDTVDYIDTGGTLAVHLAKHALRRGYRCTLYTYNLMIFDPTWFLGGGRDLPQKLADQAVEKRRDHKLVRATEAYLEYLSLGGKILFEDLDPGLLRHLLSGGRPILTGLSATFLYRCARERDDKYDDVRGEPTGHFVVLTDLDDTDGRVHVADPLQDNPAFDHRYYSVDVNRLIAAILLGMVTYDANLLVLEPGDNAPGRGLVDA